MSLPSEWDHLAYVDFVHMHHRLEDELRGIRVEKMFIAGLEVMEDAILDRLERLYSVMTPAERERLDAERALFKKLQDKENSREVQNHDEGS